MLSKIIVICCCEGASFDNTLVMIIQQGSRCCWAHPQIQARKHTLFPMVGSSTVEGSIATAPTVAQLPYVEYFFDWCKHIMVYIHYWLTLLLGLGIVIIIIISCKLELHISL